MSLLRAVTPFCRNSEDRLDSDYDSAFSACSIVQRTITTAQHSIMFLGRIVTSRLSLPGIAVKRYAILPRHGDREGLVAQNVSPPQCQTNILPVMCFVRMSSGKFRVGPAVGGRCPMKALPRRTRGKRRGRAWMVEVIGVNLLLRMGWDRAD